MTKGQLPEFLETALKRQTQAAPPDDAAVERVLSSA